MTLSVAITSHPAGIVVLRMDWAVVFVCRNNMPRCCIHADDGTLSGVVLNGGSPGVATPTQGANKTFLNIYLESIPCVFRGLVHSTSFDVTDAGEHTTGISTSEPFGTNDRRADQCQFQHQEENVDRSYVGMLWNAGVLREFYSLSNRESPLKHPEQLMCSIPSVDKLVVQRDRKILLVRTSFTIVRSP